MPLQLAGPGTVAVGTMGGLTKVAQVLILAIPLTSLVVLGALAFFTLFWDHQRRMMIIERGGTPPVRDLSDKVFLVGLVSLFVGLGLMLFFWATRGVGESLLSGIIPATAGLAIIFYRSLMSQRPK